MHLIRFISADSVYVEAKEAQTNPSEMVHHVKQHPEMTHQSNLLFVTRSSQTLPAHSAPQCFGVQVFGLSPELQRTGLLDLLRWGKSMVRKNKAMKLPQGKLAASNRSKKLEEVNTRVHLSLLFRQCSLL